MQFWLCLGYFESTFKDINSVIYNLLMVFIETGSLRTFALIVFAHPYCARKFTRHVMHERAR